MPDASLLLVRTPDLVSADMDGEIVMMSIQHGKYFGLAGIGGRIWELLEHPASLSQLVATICNEYYIDEATCSADLEKFVSDLIANGLVHPA